MTPEDLENIVPRSQSVLEISVADVIYHINNKSLSCDMDDSDMFGLSKVMSRSRDVQAHASRQSPPPNAAVLNQTSPSIEYNDHISDLFLPKHHHSHHSSDSPKIGSFLSSSALHDHNNQDLSIGGSGGSDFNGSNNEDEEFEFSDDGKEALLDNEHHSHDFFSPITNTEDISHFTPFSTSSSVKSSVKIDPDPDKFLEDVYIFHIIIIIIIIIDIIKLIFNLYLFINVSVNFY